MPQQGLILLRWAWMRQRDLEQTLPGGSVRRAASSPLRKRDSDDLVRPTGLGALAMVPQERTSSLSLLRSTGCSFSGAPRTDVGRESSH
ncbi:hypothetical protein DH86_00001222 [Scytalidium sp. 3C]|nr:hypothetical protein DH86_00001222 [Scytalidium sp. 3C]